MNRIQISIKLLKIGAVLIILLLMVLIVLSFIPSKPAPLPIPTPPPRFLVYDEESSVKDFNRRKDQQPLLEADQRIKDRLIRSLGNKSGFLEQNQSYEIEYIQPVDTFLVQIKTGDAEAVKKEAFGWFTKQGLSVSGVCNLSTRFYLGPGLTKSFKDNNMKFKPFPEECAQQ